MIDKEMMIESIKKAIDVAFLNKKSVILADEGTAYSYTAEILSQILELIESGKFDIKDHKND